MLVQNPFDVLPSEEVIRVIDKETKEKIKELERQLRQIKSDDLLILDFNNLCIQSRFKIS